MANSKRTKPIKYSDKSKDQPVMIGLFDSVKKMLTPYAKGNYYSKTDQPGQYELYYGKEIETSGRKYPELCFAGLLIQKGYLGFYFFPIYINPDLKEKLKPELLKTLKGKTCFHIKKQDPELLKQIQEAIQTGAAYYQDRGWK